MPQIPGPNGPIPYTRDELGYPRIRARNFLEGTWARGYLHASDRLVQMALVGIAASGRLMEHVGDKPLTRMVDRALRMLHLTRGLEEQVARLDDETRVFMETYCDGFNAGSSARPHPIVLRALGVPRTPLTLADQVRGYRFICYFGLTSLQHLAEAVICELLADGAPHDVFDMLVGDAAKGLDPARFRGMQVPPELRLLVPLGHNGSNAFAVAARRSATGGALLMGEFHMEIGRFPPVLYACHVDHEDDGSYYQGLGVPGVPWLSAARTPHVGWSYTYSHADNIDIAVERCRSGSYRAGDRWIPFDRRVEEVRIRGNKEPERWTYLDNPFGSLSGEAEVEGDYPVVRWSGLDDVWSDFNAQLPLLRSRTAAEAAEAHRGIKTLSLNAVIADSSGRIAWIQTGQVDRRPDGWAGVLPHPADELASRTPEVMPESSRACDLDPKDGLFVSANELRHAADGSTWTTVPEPDYRQRRITEILTAVERVDLRTMVRASYDFVDLSARRMLPVWGALLPDRAEARALVAWGSAANPDTRADNGRPAALFCVLRHEIVRAILDARIGASRTRHLLDELGVAMEFEHTLDAVLSLERPDLLAADELRKRIHEAWPRAIDRVRTGAAGLPIDARFRNMIVGQHGDRMGFSSARVRLPGTAATPFQNRVMVVRGEPMFFGPSFHLCFDMSRPHAWYNLPGGASERRLGPGYGRGVDHWISGRFLPLGSPEGAPPNLEG